MIQYWNSLEFVQPYWFLALGVLPFLVWYRYKIAAKAVPRMVYSSLEGFRSQMDLRTVVARLLPYLKLIALALMIIAMTQPRVLLREEKVRAEGIDIFLVMDLSSSMLSKDFEPDRLTVAKSVASNFVGDRPYDRFGLTVFAGESFTQSPLTTDQMLLKSFLAQMRSGYLEDGTAIGMGLASAVNRLKDSEASSKVIILLTDGVNNAGFVAPLQAAQIAKEFDITVYTIGIGSLGQALSPVQRRSDGTYIFAPAKVEIDEALLREISLQTGGKYYRATDEETLEKVYQEIDKLEKTEIEVTTIKRYTNQFRRFIQWSMALWLISFLLSATIFKIHPEI